MSKNQKVVFKHKALDAQVAGCFKRVTDAEASIRDTYVNEMRKVAKAVTRKFKTDATIEAYARKEFAMFFHGELEKDKSIKPGTRKTKKSNAVKIVTCSAYAGRVLDAVLKTAKQNQNIENAFLTALTPIRDAIKQRKSVTKAMIEKTVKASVKTRKTAKEKTAGEALMALVKSAKAFYEKYDLTGKDTAEMQAIVSGLTTLAKKYE